MSSFNMTKQVLTKFGGGFYKGSHIKTERPCVEESCMNLVVKITSL